VLCADSGFDPGSAGLSFVPIKLIRPNRRKISNPQAKSEQIIGQNFFRKHSNCREKSFLQDKFEGKEEEKHRFSSLKSFLANLFGTRNTVQLHLLSKITF